MLKDWCSLDGSKTREVTASITLDQIIQTDYFRGRESNDSEYGLEDPCEKEYEHHYKDTVSHNFFTLDTGNASSAKEKLYEGCYYDHLAPLL